MNDKYRQMRMAVENLELIETFDVTAKQYELDPLEKIWKIKIPELDINLLSFSGHWNSQKEIESLCNTITKCIKDLLEVEVNKAKKILSE